MTDAAILHFNFHLLITERPRVVRKRLQFAFRLFGGQGMNFAHAPVDAFYEMLLRNLERFLVFAEHLAERI